MVTLPLLLVLAAANQAAPQPSCLELRSRADAAYLEGRLAGAAGVSPVPRAVSVFQHTGHEKLIEIAKRRNPHHRLTTPENVARCLAALCHPATYWLTGNAIHVDGGENIVG